MTQPQEHPPTDRLPSDSAGHQLPVITGEKNQQSPTKGSFGRITATPNESDLAEWLGEQIDALDAGTLEPEKRSLLDSGAPGWDSPKSRAACGRSMPDGSTVFLDADATVSPIPGWGDLHALAGKRVEAKSDLPVAGSDDTTDWETASLISSVRLGLVTDRPSLLVELLAAQVASTIRAHVGRIEDPDGRARTQAALLGDVAALLSEA
jgi:hypothetical protein